NFGSVMKISGGGKIKIRSNGAGLTTLGSGAIDVNAVIQNEIVLNSDNLSGAFSTNIGALGGHFLTLGVVSGNSDVNFASSSGSAGAGTIILNGSMTYTGQTMINTGLNNGTLGVMRL